MDAAEITCGDCELRDTIPLGFFRKVTTLVLNACVLKHSTKWYDRYKPKIVTAQDRPSSRRLWDPAAQDSGSREGVAPCKNAAHQPLLELGAEVVEPLRMRINFRLDRLRDCCPASASPEVVSDGL